MHPPPLPIIAPTLAASAAPKRPILRVVLTLAILVAGAVLLYTHNPVPEPGHASYFPPCPFYKLSGLYCPGCGATRALHALLHGHVAAAFDFNPLLVVALPFILYLVGRDAVRTLRPDLLRPARPMPQKWMWTILCVVLAYAILRNLPYPALAWMAP